MPGHEYFNSIVGNSALRERLASDILAGKLPHACIIEGPEGSGKRTLALSAAAALCCEDRDGNTFPCGECLACRKIFGGKTPDIIHVFTDKDKSSIGVDASRFMRTDVLTVPNDFAYKIYIIEDAEKMTAQAQNALLLTLEEPPKYVVFFILCRTASALLETVRSRAPVFRTEPVSAALLADYIKANDRRASSLAGSSPDEFSELVSASYGCIGRALRLLDPKERKPVIDRRQLARNFVSSFSHPKSASTNLGVLSAFSIKREDATVELLCISDAVRDLIVLKKSEDAPLCFWSDREEALDISCRFTMSSLLSLSGRIDNAAAALTRNANLRLTLLNLLS